MNTGMMVLYFVVASILSMSCNNNTTKTDDRFVINKLQDMYFEDNISLKYMNFVNILKEIKSKADDDIQIICQDIPEDDMNVQILYAINNNSALSDIFYICYKLNLIIKIQAKKIIIMPQSSPQSELMLTSIEGPCWRIDDEKIGSFSDNDIIDVLHSKNIKTIYVSYPLAWKNTITNTSIDSVAEVIAKFVDAGFAVYYCPVANQLSWQNDVILMEN